MKHIDNVLIGVDLSDGDKLVSPDFAPSTLEAIELGLRIAKQCGARAHFFYSLDIGAQAQRSIQEDQSTEATVLDKARSELQKIVAQAEQQGIVADAEVTFGKSWLELIRYAVKHGCDSVVVGAKQHGALERLFIGTTGMNLLRNCPCPVWVTHPPNPESAGTVLVCHDLTAVGQQALELGAAVAEYRQSPLHVMHVIEAHHVEVADPLLIEVRAEEADRQAIRERISQEIDALGISVPTEIHLTAGHPDEAIREYIDEHEIDLLVMGTLARHGVEGLLIGNTAERLLQKVPCSVLAVKPDWFKTPVSVD